MNATWVAVVAGSRIALPSAVRGNYEAAVRYAMTVYGTSHVERVA
jgi:hypothetical protein